jgi:SAM-dependent methyltransferase
MAADPLDRVEQLLEPSRTSIAARRTGGYLDVLDAPAPADGAGARLMRSGFYPLIYQRIRPIGLRLMSGLAEPGRDADRERAADRLGLEPGHRILDVACGPGNFTEFFAGVVGESGLAVGLDASPTMLAQAVRDNSVGQVAYVHGDAAALPFADASFDAVSCFAALYLMSEPYVALEEAVRVLRPGGRIAILTSFVGTHVPVRIGMRAGQLFAGIRAFGRNDITKSFTGLGLTDVRQEINGVAQAVWARKPD